VGRESLLMNDGMEKSDPYNEVFVHLHRRRADHVYILSLDRVDFCFSSRRKRLAEKRDADIT
jgi:hypothetical protein